MEIEELADFRLVALHGGIGKAARVSGRPKATLSKRVIDLEASLGVRLFDRTSHALQLTDEGRKLCTFVDGLVDAMDNIRDELGATTNEPKGKLRVAAPSLFTYLCMGDVAAKFLKAHPGVEIETTVVEPPNEAAADFFDVLIKVNPPPSSELVGRVFARDSTRVVGAPEVVEQLLAKVGDDPVRVEAVAPTGMSKLGPWDLDVQGRKFRVLPDIKLHFPSRLVMRDAVCAGFGLADLPAGLVTDDIKQGRLIDLGAAPTPSVEIWALYASRRLVSRRVSAFVAFLCEYFKNSPIAP